MICLAASTALVKTSRIEGETWITKVSAIGSPIFENGSLPSAAVWGTPSTSSW